MTLCVLLWAVDGRVHEMTEYEDVVLGLIPEHGGSVLNRLRNTAGDDGPTEVQVIEFPSQLSLDQYMNDSRRLERAADRDRWVARTEVIRVKPV
jgi:uncharacterized protein (DUF1330 family)